MPDTSMARTEMLHRIESLDSQVDFELTHRAALLRSLVRNARTIEQLDAMRVQYRAVLDQVTP